MSSPSSSTWPSSTVSSRLGAAQQRRLARARAADQGDDLVLADREVDPAQHDVVAEDLDHAAHVEHRRGRRARSQQARPTAGGAGRGRVTASASRAEGTASSTNSRPATTYGVKLNVWPDHDLRRPDGVDRAEHGDQSDVLLQRDEVVEQRAG